MALFRNWVAVLTMGLMLLDGISSLFGQQSHLDNSAPQLTEPSCSSRAGACERVRFADALSKATNAKFTASGERFEKMVVELTAAAEAKEVLDDEIGLSFYDKGFEHLYMVFKSGKGLRDEWMAEIVAGGFANVRSNVYCPSAKQPASGPKYCALKPSPSGGINSGNIDDGRDRIAKALTETSSKEGSNLVYTVCGENGQRDALCVLDRKAPNDGFIERIGTNAEIAKGLYESGFRNLIVSNGNGGFWGGLIAHEGFIPMKDGGATKDHPETSTTPTPDSRWQELDSQASELTDQGKYAEALPIAKEAERTAEAAFGPDDAKVATALANLALIYQKQSKFGEAEPLYERALRIDIQELGPEHPNVGSILGNLGSLYETEGKYGEAETFHQRALHVDEKALGPEDLGVASDLINLAVAYTDEGRYIDAEPPYQRALRIEEKALGGADPSLARLLNSVAQLYQLEGKYREAEPLFQRALHIVEKASGPEPQDIPAALNNLAQLYVDEGTYVEAEPLFERALNIREKNPVKDDPAAAVEVSDLAALYFYEGRYLESEQFYQRALSMCEKSVGADDPEVAAVLNGLAELYDEDGKYARAEPLLQRALHINEKAFGPGDPRIAKAISNLAGLYSEEGKFAETEPLLKRALGIDEKAFGPEHPDVATDLHNLAVLYLDEGKDASAEPLSERALHIWEKTLGPNHPLVARALNTLAGIRQTEKKYAEAEPLFQRSLRIDETALGPVHPSVASDLNNLAALFVIEGKYRDAQPLLDRALEVNQKALGVDHPIVATALNNLASLHDDMGDYVAAKPLYQRAFDNLFEQFQYNFTYMTERERLGFLDTVASYFPGYFSFVHRFRNDDPSLIGSMYNVLLWEKGFVAGSVTDMRRQVEASGDADSIELLGQLSAKRTRISAILNVNPTDRDLWRKQVDQLRAEANDIERALVARSSTFAGQKKKEKATWQQVRDALRPGEAAVEFARFRFFDKKWTDTFYYVALVVTPERKDQPEYIFLGDDKQFEGDMLARFQQSVHTRGLIADEDAAIPGAKVYDLIWKPLEKSLAGRTRIYLSPDGNLNRIPLGIIPSPDGRLQMEKYDLRLLSSTRDILRIPAPNSSKDAVLIGDPFFDLSEDQQLAATRKLVELKQQKQVTRASTAIGDPPRELANGTLLPELPGTGEEVNTISDLMRGAGWEARVYTRDVALKQVVDETKSPRVLHLATHGFFLSDREIKTDGAGLPVQTAGLEDPMLRSGLYFAGADRALAGKPSPAGLDNGVLTAMEAGNLNLTGTELVVLSACNTGQGDVKNGEGIFGLRRALQEAGAGAVLMSLWSVPDNETRELMQLFYRKWISGMEKHQALKEAQLEIRETVKLRYGGRDLPYYWGSFVLVGK